MSLKDGQDTHTHTHTHTHAHTHTHTRTHTHALTHSLPDELKSCDPNQLEDKKTVLWSVCSEKLVSDLNQVRWF